MPTKPQEVGAVPSAVPVTFARGWETSGSSSQKAKANQESGREREKERDTRERRSGGERKKREKRRESPGSVVCRSRSELCDYRKRNHQVTANEAAVGGLVDEVDDIRHRSGR